MGVLLIEIKKSNDLLMLFYFFKKKTDFKMKQYLTTPPSQYLLPRKLDPT
jgi:hypothetical protein